LHFDSTILTWFNFFSDPFRLWNAIVGFESDCPADMGFRTSEYEAPMNSVTKTSALPSTIKKFPAAGWKMSNTEDVKLSDLKISIPKIGGGPDCFRQEHFPTLTNALVLISVAMVPFCYQEANQFTYLSCLTAFGHTSLVFCFLSVEPFIFTLNQWS
jgi:hypothetical protein